MMAEYRFGVLTGKARYVVQLACQNRFLSPASVYVLCTLIMDRHEIPIAAFFGKMGGAEMTYTRSFMQLRKQTYT